MQLHFLQMHDSVQLFPNYTRIHVITYTNFSSHDIPCYIWISYSYMTIATEVCRLVEGQQFGEAKGNLSFECMASAIISQNCTQIHVITC